VETLRKHFAASVGLVHASISEDELAVCRSALSYALESLSDADIESRLGATRSEVEDLRDDLLEASRELDEVRQLTGVKRKI
jgi:hypothetical protein